ncbi:MAG: hypothetical protein ABI670_19820 [Chloroflexota bacterium]
MPAKLMPAPARLFVHLAREVHVAVILRRGPSKWVQAILWHTNNDTFEYGQWFHGRIYDRVCDLSPDGSTFLYFAVRDHLRNRDMLHAPGLIRKWTAMSKPPYLTALSLWPNFDHFYMGGGYFIDKRTVYLFSDAEEKPEKGSIPENLKVITSASEQAGELPGKDDLNGWTQVQERVWQFPPGRALKPEILRKDNYQSKYSILRKSSTFHEYDYYLLDHTSNKEIRMSDVTWVDFDQKGRLVLTRDGKLFALEPGGLLENAREITDFNSQRFTEVIAPEWALHW